MMKSICGASTAAVISVTFIHPIDVVKTRMQVSGTDGGRNYKELGIRGTVKVIHAQEGLKAFWKGIQPAYLREASYTGIRIGLYGPVKSWLGVNSKSSFLMKFLSGSISGGLGSLVGNPFDVLKTRMMTSEQKGLPFSEVVKNILNENGVKGFYKGLQANIMRACVLNGTKMGCYDQIKTMLLGRKIVKKKGLLLEFCSAFAAGFFMTCTVAPFDKLRSLLMNQKPGAESYSGFIDCLTKVVRREGPQGLWVGFIPIWSRFAPTTTCQLVIFSYIKKWFNIKE